MNNLKVQGFFLLDVDVVALNNAGKSTLSNNDNAIATKKVYKHKRPYAYISGQAFGQWWRDTLQKQFSWELSPVLRESKTAFTAANPIKYPDDDVFGYVKAAKEASVDEESGEVKTNTKGKAVMEDITVTRIAPLKKSAIVSVAPVGIARNWSSMDGKGLPHKLLQLPAELRVQRAIDVIQALKVISGGAMQTNNMGDITPKFIILALMPTGNHPFGHVFSEKVQKVDVEEQEIATVSQYGDRVQLNIDGIKEVLKDYKKQITGQVFIGVRAGFMDEYAAELKELQNLGAAYPLVSVASIGDALDGFCEQIKKEFN